MYDSTSISEIHSIGIFHSCFIVLGSIPAIALFYCKFINNKKALAQITEPSHIPTEAEFETE
jgi:hypothetical protein